MKAVVLHAPKSLAYMDMPMPEIGPDDILLQVKAAGICGGDIHFYTGHINSKRYPLIIGHEFSGVIAQVGANVQGDWKVGDRVVSDNTGFACGKCHACISGHPVNCDMRETLGISMDGGFAPYVRIPGDVLRIYPSSLMKIPDSIDFPEATVLEPAAGTYRALIQTTKVRAGDVVVVFGAGTMGLLSVQMARIAGASEIILVGMQQDVPVRMPIGMKVGATHWLVNDGQPDIREKLRDILGDREVDLVVDAVGLPVVLDAALDIVRTEGTIIRIGLEDKPLPFGLNRLTFKAIRLQGHNGYDAVSWRNCITLADKGLLDLKALITNALPMARFEEGIVRSIKCQETKVILIPEDV